MASRTLPLDNEIQTDWGTRYKIENGSVIFDIAVRNFSHLFDMRDPSPFRERDLDDDLVEYIMLRAEEIPPDMPITLRFFSKEPIAESDPANIATAVESFFTYEAGLLSRKMRESFRMGRSFLVLGLITLLGCLLIAGFIDTAASTSTAWKLVREGITITGWVAMWRPIEIILYGWWPLRDQQKQYLRLSKSKIEVSCA